MNVCTIKLNVYLCLCHRTCDEAEEQQKRTDFKNTDRAQAAKWLICKQVGVMVHLLKCIFFSMKSGRFMTLIIYAAPLFPMSVTTAGGSGLHDPSIYFGLARH